LLPIGQEITMGNSDKDNNAKEYIKRCHLIVKKIIDLSVFTLLIRLWEDKRTGKIALSDKDKTEIEKYFQRGSVVIDKTCLTFLHRLMNLYSTVKIEKSTPFLPELLTLTDSFNENGKLYSLCLELDKLTTISDLNRFDFYRSEKILTEFLEMFHFLVNYKMISMNEIEYRFIINCEQTYLHRYKTIGNQGQNDEIQSGDLSGSGFTHAILLYKGNNFQDSSINLYPFVIDYNALLEDNSNSKLAELAFLYSSGRNDKLSYEYVASKDKIENQYFNLIQKDISSPNVYSKENIEAHNFNCVLKTFKEIKNCICNQ
jgi:hypothetical protein